jgi:hypothetical protein
MNLIEFNKILIQPSLIKKDQIDGLNTIIEEYPYFHVAHFLHLKALKTRHSFKYNDYLKKTAAYTTDRSVLFDSITSDDLDIHPAPANLIIPETADKEEQHPEDTKVIAGTTEENVSPEETLGIGRPLKFKSDESHSFQEWLQLSSFEPIDRTKTTAAPIESVMNLGKERGAKDKIKMDLVDKFIASSPKINPSLYDSYADVAMDSVQENESLMTETLAHVYVEQKKYEKAITAFTILSLKYPEKSSFFALQIRAIKKLQEK